MPVNTRKSTRSTTLSPASSSHGGAHRSAATQTVDALDQLCASLAPGDRIPTHTELMRRFGASERAVRDALGEMQRRGRIVRRNGVGTFVSELHPPSFSPVLPAVSRPIIALTQPDRGFFDRCMDLLFRHAEIADVRVVCQPVRLNQADVYDTVSHLARATQPLGFVLFSYRLAPLAQKLQADGGRVVVVGAPPADAVPQVPCIYNDHEHGGYLATRHLIDEGHRRLAYVHAGGGDLTRALRWQGHQRALRQARQQDRLVITDTLLLETETDGWEAAPERAKAFLSTPDAPTGLLAWNDHEAARILACLLRAGVRVPEEVSLIGYDALPEGTLAYPRLTTVDHALSQQLSAAVRLLTQPTPPPSTYAVVTTPTLIQRDSTGPAPAISAPHEFSARLIQPTR